MYIAYADYDVAELADMLIKAFYSGAGLEAEHIAAELVWRVENTSV